MIRHGAFALLFAIGCSGQPEDVPPGIDEGALADQDPGKADSTLWVQNEGAIGCAETKTGKTGPIANFDAYTFKQVKGGKIGFDVTANHRARLLVYGPQKNGHWGGVRLADWASWNSNAQAYRTTIKWTVPEEGKYLVVLGSYVYTTTQYSLAYYCDSQPHCVEYISTGDTHTSLRNFYAINVNSYQEGKDQLAQLNGNFIEEAINPGRCSDQSLVCAEIYAPVCAADITPDNGPEPQQFGNVCEFKAAVRQASANSTWNGAKGHYDIGECNPAVHWYWTCGTPVCMPDSTDPAYLAIPVCSGAQVDGNACLVEGEFCRPAQYSCGRLLKCQQSRPVVCPISQRDKKRDIKYLDDAGLQKQAKDLLALKLATYQYKEAPATSAHRLGFIIEDGAPAVSVDEKREHVDLYGYTSLAVATLKVQQKQIEALKAEIDALKAQLARRASR